MDFKGALKDILLIKGETALNDKSTVQLLEDYGAFDMYPAFRSILESILEMGIGNVLYNVFFDSIMTNKGVKWDNLKNMLLELPYDDVFIKLFFKDLEYALLGFANEKNTYDRNINTDIEEMLGRIWVDDRGVKYSIDKKKLINACDVNGNYVVKQDTQEIGPNAFLRNHNVEIVILPKNLKKIDRNAFNNCKNLKKIDFCDNITEIGEYAFGNCLALTEVCLPRCLSEISQGLFSYCSELLYVHISKSVTHIGPFAFWGCNSLQYLVLPDNVSCIGESAFDYCNSLRYVVLPSGLNNADKNLFDKCRSLKYIYIPTGTFAQYKQQFPNCSELFKEYKQDEPVYIDTIQNNTLPFWITRNGEVVLNTLYTLQDECDVNEIRSFEEEGMNVGQIYKKDGHRYYLSPILRCKSAAEILSLADKIMIAKITINSGKDWINYAFMSNYETYFTVFDTLPSGCYYESKGHNMCPHIRQSDKDDFILDEMGVAYSTDMKRLLFVPGKIKEYMIPNGVEIICDRAFEGNLHLKSVTIPDSVVFIGDFAFSGCRLLEHIIIPYSVEYLGMYAFWCCSSLCDVKIYNGLISIGDWAFSSCCFKTLGLPDSVRYIGRAAFSKCTKLTTLVIPKSIIYIGEGAFYGSKLKKLHIPQLPMQFVNVYYYFYFEPKHKLERRELYFKYPRNGW